MDLSELQLKLLPDEIICGKCPVRIDLAGSWTDLSPYCNIQRGSIINMAVDLNNQPPIHVYIKRNSNFIIRIHCINNGLTETIRNYNDLENYKSSTSLFSIVKAALILTGLFDSKACFEECLKNLGTGFQITLFSAVSVGTGIGTTSIIAATLLGALSILCRLNWDNLMICKKAVILEQMLEINAGWQNQYGGVLNGIKFLEVESLNNEYPIVKWLPDHLFVLPEYKSCQLLYYTGIQRTDNRNFEVSSKINEGTDEVSDLLESIKENTYGLFKAIQVCDYDRVGLSINKTRTLNSLIDNRIIPNYLLSLFNKIDDYCIGYKMLGSGYSYMYMMAKDIKAVNHIKSVLLTTPINSNARFIDFSLSTTGLSICKI